MNTTGKNSSLHSRLDNTRLSDEANTTSNHAAFELIQSGDRFLALATTAIPENRFWLDKSQSVSRDNSDLVRYEEPFNRSSTRCELIVDMFLVIVYIPV